MTLIQIDQLARETFELGKKLGQLHRLDKLSDDFLDQIDRDEFWSHDFKKQMNDQEDTFKNEEIIDQEVNLPHSAGIIFKLEKGTATFCIRAIAVDNIAEDYQDVMDDNRGLRKILRIDSSLSNAEIEKQLYYFETPIVENAEILVETFAHQRLPLKESQLLNISDPGHDWWLEEGLQQITIHFRAPSIERESAYINLGPLGDSKLLVARLQRLKEHFQRSIRGLEIKGNERHLLIEVANGELITPFKKLFKEGFNSWSQDQQMETTLYLFLEELATARRFWKYLSKVL